MDNEYYTPDLWEFHVGFEYQLKGATSFTNKVFGMTRDGDGFMPFDMILRNMEDPDKDPYSDYCFYNLISKGNYKGLRLTSFHDFPQHKDNNMEYNPHAHIRVKYLDYDDFEQLGFTSMFGEELDKINPDVIRVIKYNVRPLIDGYGAALDACYVRSTKTLSLRHVVSLTSHIDFNEDTATNLFNGIIKNKSELGRLLKQLNL